MRFRLPGRRNQQDRVGPSGVRRRQMHRLPLLHVGLSLSGATLSVDEAGAVCQEVRSVLRARKGRQSARMYRACPVEAGIFGDRDQLIAEAWNRIRSDSSYVPRIYGSEEAGGGSVLFVSDVEFEKLGF